MTTETSAEQIRKAIQEEMGHLFGASQTEKQKIFVKAFQKIVPKEMMARFNIEQRAALATQLGFIQFRLLGI